MIVELAEWAWLAPHGKRGALILVEAGLDLLSVGERIAKDDQVAVREWLEQGKLTRPGTIELGRWEQSQSKQFKYLIVQPWVLIQELEL